MGFFSSLLGKDSERLARQGAAAQRGEINTGLGAQQGYYRQADERLAPYETRGNEANAMYAALLRGDPEAVQQFQSNPLLQGNIGQASNAMLRYLNARGGATGGRGLVAAQEVAQRGAMDFLDRYGQLGQQGLQVAGARSNLLTGMGENEMGAAAMRAGVTGQEFSNRIAAKNQGVNNLLGLIGAGTKIATAGWGQGGFMRS